MLNMDIGKIQYFNLTLRTLRGKLNCTTKYGQRERNLQEALPRMPTSESIIVLYLGHGDCVASQWLRPQAVGIFQVFPRTRQPRHLSKLLVRAQALLS